MTTPITAATVYAQFVEDGVVEDRMEYTIDILCEIDGLSIKEATKLYEVLQLGLTPKETLRRLTS